MLNSDSISLLQECHSGILMGIDSYEDVIPKIKSQKLLGIVNENKKSHIHIEKEIRDLLAENKQEPKKPPATASAMAEMSTGFKLAIKGDDAQVACILADGCNMGIKSLSKYKNKYATAENKAVSMVNDIIDMEETMHQALREFL